MTQSRANYHLVVPVLGSWSSPEKPNIIFTTVTVTFIPLSLILESAHTRPVSESFSKARLSFLSVSPFVCFLCLFPGGLQLLLLIPLSLLFLSARLYQDVVYQHSGLTHTHTHISMCTEGMFFRKSELMWSEWPHSGWLMSALESDQHSPNIHTFLLLSSHTQVKRRTTHTL